MDSQTPGPSTPMTGGMPPNPAAMPAPQAPQPMPSKKPKKSKKALLVILILLILGGAAAAGYYYILKPSNETSTTTVAPDNTTDKKSPAITNTSVVITDKGVNPQVVKIAVGSQVTWQNNDKSPHRISADPYPTKTSLPELDSQDPLETGESFSFIFEKAGTYTYNDYLNPTNKSFQGTVIVE